MKRYEEWQHSGRIDRVLVQRVEKGEQFLRCAHAPYMHLETLHKAP